MAMRKAAPTKDDLLLRLQSHLSKLFADTKLGDLDPFDLDVYEEKDFPTKKYVNAFLGDLVTYFEVAEGWNLKGSSDLNFVDIAGAIYRTARAQKTTPLSHPLMQGIGGYLSSDWLVFVPFLGTVDVFKNKKGAYDRSFKMRGNNWVIPIWESMKVTTWIDQHLPQKPILRVDPAGDRASLFLHQMCQIGGGTYDGKLVRGHYFIFRCKGSLRSLDAALDPSKYFALFAHGITALNGKGKSIYNAPLFGQNMLSPDGIIGVNLKNLEPNRFRRHTDFRLNIRLTKDLLNAIRARKFSAIAEKLFTETLDDNWKRLKTCADLLYQFIENEAQDNNEYTKHVLSTVLLCASGEALLGITDKQKKKRSFSVLIALLNSGWKSTDFETGRKFLEDCYDVRSSFVHDGSVEKADNARLFSFIFKAWHALAIYYLSSGATKYSPIEYLNRKVPKNNPLFRSVFVKEYFS